MHRVNEARFGDDYAEELRFRRDAKENTFLKLCRMLYLTHRQFGRHARIEQPAQAMSWETRTFRDLPGYAAKLDVRFGGTRSRWTYLGPSAEAHDHPHDEVGDGAGVGRKV